MGLWDTITSDLDLAKRVISERGWMEFFGQAGRSILGGGPFTSGVVPAAVGIAGGAVGGAIAVAPAIAAAGVAGAKATAARIAAAVPRAAPIAQRASSMLVREAVKALKPRRRKRERPCKFGPRDEDGYCPPKPAAAKPKKGRRKSASKGRKAHRYHTGARRRRRRR